VTVGAGVGVNVGDGVGLAVGNGVGLAVGSCVGDGVGSKVGESVGAGVIGFTPAAGAAKKRANARTIRMWLVEVCTNERKSQLTKEVNSPREIGAP
jgi:hypothetical protein